MTQFGGKKKAFLLVFIYSFDKYILRTYRARLDTRSPFCLIICNM